MSMKAKIKATDLLFGKSIEVECTIRKDAAPEKELVYNARKRDISQKIIKELRLSFGEAKLELISYGRVIAVGTMTNNVFAGGGHVTAKPCTPYEA